MTLRAAWARYVNLCKKRNKLILECAEVIKSYVDRTRVPLLRHDCIEELERVFEKLKKTRKRLRRLYEVYGER